MASPRRIEKLNNLLREELGKIIDREMDFPAGTFVTITQVDISPDAHYADVFISIISQEPKNVLAILGKNIYHIQQELNQHLRMRPVPRIKFLLDEKEYRREKIEKKLADLKKE